MTSHEKKLVAVDIGGTGVKTGLLTETGTNLASGHFPTPRHDYRLMTEMLMNHIDENYATDFDGIAISSTGLVDPGTQEIGMSSPIYEPFGKELVRQLQARYRVPVSAENDGNCALLAEKWQGAGQNCHDLAMIVLGTSVGGAVMIEEKLVRGSHLLGGEFGYMLMPVKQGAKRWEIWSITGATRSLVLDTALKKGVDPADLDGRQVTELLAANDKEAQEAVADFIEQLAVGCYNLQYVLDPQKILIGGGISKADFLLPMLQEKIAEISSHIPSNVLLPEIAICRFGNESNLLGAVYDWRNKFGCGQVVAINDEHQL